MSALAPNGTQLARMRTDDSVSVDDLLDLMARIADIIRRHVASREARSAIAAEIRLITIPGGLDLPSPSECSES